MNKRNSRFLLLFLFLIPFLTACPSGGYNGPKGSIEGFVVNRKAGTAVADAEVKVDGFNFSAKTNSQGFYSIKAPANDKGISLSFSKTGYALSKVEGLTVSKDEVTHYDTLLPERFDDFLPLEAPSLSINVNDGDTLNGTDLSDQSPDAFKVKISGSVAKPNLNGFVFADVALGKAGGNSGYLNASVPHTGVFSFDGSEQEVVVFATGFDGETTLHFTAYDGNSNRTELIRHVVVKSNSPVAAPTAVTNASAYAITFGDVSIFGTLAKSSKGLGSALRTGDTARLLELVQAKPLSNLRPQSYLDEVLTWVEVSFDYNPTSLPSAFEIYRQKEGETGFRLIGRASPYQLAIFNNNNDLVGFSYIDSDASLKAGVKTTYRVDAVTGSARKASNTSATTPLAPLVISSTSPADASVDTSRIPTYQMKISGRSSLVFYGAIVLDRIQAEGSIVEWIGSDVSTDPAETTLSLVHNSDGLATLERLQAFHAYDWQPLALSSNGQLDENGQLVEGSETAISIAADALDLFGFGFGVSDVPVNTFVTGNGN